MAQWKTKRIMLVVALFTVSFAVPQAFAWEQGHLKIDTAFEAEEQWDSNIFYDSNNEKDDFVTLLTPSIYGIYGFGPEGKHKLKMGYEVEIGLFAEYHDQNYGNHKATGGLSLDFDEYTFDINNDFRFTSSRAGTEFQHRTLRKEDTMDAVLGMHFNKFDMDIGYTFFLVDYLSDTLDDIDRYENSGWIAGYVQVMPKTKALLEFTYTNIQYPDASGRDGNAYRIMTGVKGEITAKLSGTAKAGYKYKEYDDSTHKDYSGAAAYVDLLYTINDRTDLLFAYTREPFESTYLNNNYYTGDHFLTRFNYRFGGNFLAKVDGQYFYNAYPEIATGESKKRRDHEWAVGVGLDYFWKDWLVTGIGYRFHQRDSNIGDRSYDQHVIDGNIKLMF